MSESQSEVHDKIEGQDLVMRKVKADLVVEGADTK
jgi:hypothetical protein